MKKYRFSKQAESDLDDILTYTAERWGDQQADAYLTDLLDCFQRVVQMPQLGRDCSYLHKGLRRIEQGRHVIFYEEDGSGIFIVRILHQGMTPEKHLSED